MSDRKIETVQAIYEAFGRSDIEAILAHLTDDVDWASCPDSNIAPWHGRHHGKNEVPMFFKALAGALDVSEFTQLSIAANDNDVLVVTRFGATSRATGKTALMDIHHWWRFRDGLICLYRGTEDTALTQAMLSTD